MANSLAFSGQRRITLLILVSCILHPGQSHFLASAPSYPVSYAALYTNQYSVPQQELWPEQQSVGVVQVHPPTFHGKYFQKNLYPIWARSVGLATEDPQVYAPAATLVSPYHLAAPAQYHTAIAYPAALHTVITPTIAHSPAESNAAGAHLSPIANALGAAAPKEAAAPTTDATQAATVSPQPSDSAAAAAAEGTAASITASPNEATTDAVTPTATTLAAEATTMTDDLEPTVDSGASNNVPTLLGAPNDQNSVSIKVPEADGGKRVVIYQFPNLLEGLVQRFQNYFSTYNHITATSISNAVANSNASSSSSSNSESNSSSKSDSKSDSKSESDSKSDSDSGSNSGSNSQSDAQGAVEGTGNVNGAQSAPVKEPPTIPHPTNHPVGQSPVTPAVSEPAAPLEVPHHPQTPTGVPATTNRPPSSYLPPSDGYPHSQQQQQQYRYLIDPPQKSQSYELHITQTPRPAQGYSYDRPRVPFDPYRHLRGRQYHRNNAQNWQGQQYSQGQQRWQGQQHNRNEHFGRQRHYDRYQYPRY